MDRQTEQLWDELDELLQAFDWKYSGPEEAALGCYGRRLVRNLIRSDRRFQAEWADFYLDLLWRGFNSLECDYRISKDVLDCMRFAYSRLRWAACWDNRSDPSCGGAPDNRQ